MTSLVGELSRVDPRARVARDTFIGPGCVIGPEVEIGRGTRLVGHVCLLGIVRIGEFNTIEPFVAIGSEPQDLSYWGTATSRLAITTRSASGSPFTEAPRRKTASPGWGATIIFTAAPT